MLLIFTDKITSRLSYIVKLIFDEILQINTGLTNSLEEFENYTGPKINYSYRNFDFPFSIIPHELLFREDIKEQKIVVTNWGNTKIFFQNPNNSLLPFDILAACFYLVTRYEEYLETYTDKFGRFNPEYSLAYQNGFLEKPIINEWVVILKNALHKIYPYLLFSGQPFNYLTTIDVDVAYAHKNRGLIRNALSAGKLVINMNFKELTEKFQIWFGIKPDPFDIYDNMDEILQTDRRKVLWFFQVGKYGKLDKNQSVKNKKYRSLIRNLAHNFKIGLHPSFQSNKNINLLKNEIATLSKIINKPVKYSRHHYLVLKFPETYQNLIKFGILEDYTLGYPSHPGFRAGICNPFYFFDLSTNKKTNLRIFPFQVMDNMMLTYLKYSPHEAMDKLEQIINEVKKYKGLFISIWHNDFFTNKKRWEGWLPVYYKMLELLNEK